MFNYFLLIETGYDRNKNVNNPVTHPTYVFKTIDHLKEKKGNFVKLRIFCQYIGCKKNRNLL